MIAIELKGAMPTLIRFEGALQSAGLSTESRPELRESRGGFHTASELVKIMIYADFEVGKPLGRKVAQHVKDHGIDAGIGYVVAQVIGRMKTRDPNARAEIIDTEHG